MTKFVIKSFVNHISANSRAVTAGGLFLAFPGEKDDGRKHIAQAIANGASAVLWDDKKFKWDANWDVENIPITNLKLQAGVIAGQFYQKPSNKMWMIGVTGTNGKTSISHWLSQCFSYLGNKTAVIGTLGNGFSGQLEKTNNTTPDAVVLQSKLADFVKQGAEVVAMEVSSHGLHQGRVNGVHFDVAILSNITRDHMDYHGTMKEYTAAKRSLFDWEGLGAAVINTDDSYGEKFVKELELANQYVMTYGIKTGAVRATSVQYETDGISALVETPQGNAQLNANVIGEFNVYNLLAVLATLLVSKVPLTAAIEAIAQIKSAPGRMQLLGGGNDPTVIVDYAHTPDALEKVLQTLKAQATHRLICVFGCGGNRDVGKRPEMGRIASEYADTVIVTSDNPRDENPQNIINDILSGTSGNFLIEPDRAKAIRVAVETSEFGDIVLIAGKGHEDYQEIAGIKQHFSDVQQVQLALKNYDEAFE